MSDKPIQVGDNLAFDFGWTTGWVIKTVTRITSTGRIQCEGYTLNADLTIRGDRGSFGPFCGYRITPEIQDKCDRQRYTSRIRNFNFNKLTTAGLRTINLTLDELET